MSQLSIGDQLIANGLNGVEVPRQPARPPFTFLSEFQDVEAEGVERLQLLGQHLSENRVVVLMLIDIRDQGVSDTLVHPS